MAMMSTEAAARTTADLVPLATLFRALGEAPRLLILEHLHAGPHRVVDLVDHLGLAQSTVSKHLACLRDCGLVEVHAEGRASVYRLAPEVPVAELLDLAEAVLGTTGAAVERCRIARTAR